MVTGSYREASKRNKRQECWNLDSSWIQETVFLHADTWQHTRRVHRDASTRMLTAALFVIEKNGDNLNFFSSETG